MAIRWATLAPRTAQFKKRRATVALGQHAPIDFAAAGS
jgi:hypothetical protein